MPFIFNDGYFLQMIEMIKSFMNKELEALHRHSLFNSNESQLS